MTAPADPREALAPAIVAAVHAFKEAENEDHGEYGRGCVHFDKGYGPYAACEDPDNTVPLRALPAILAARQDEPSPALRPGLDAAIDAIEAIPAYKPKLSNGRAPRDAHSTGFVAGVQTGKEVAVLAIRALRAANPPQTREAEGAALLEAALLEVGHPTYFDGKTTWMHVPDGWFERRTRALLARTPEAQRDAPAEPAKDYDRLVDLATDAVLGAAQAGMFFPALELMLGMEDGLTRRVADLASMSMPGLQENVLDVTADPATYTDATGGQRDAGNRGPQEPIDTDRLARAITRLRSQDPDFIGGLSGDSTARLIVAEYELLAATQPPVAGTEAPE